MANLFFFLRQHIQLVTVLCNKDYHLKKIKISKPYMQKKLDMLHYFILNFTKIYVALINFFNSTNILQDFLLFRKDCLTKECNGLILEL